jgi:hypothetical protein
LWSVRAALLVLAYLETKAAIHLGAWSPQSLLVVAVALLAEAQRALHQQEAQAAAAQEQLDTRRVQQEHQAKVLQVVAHRVRLLITLRVAAGALAL